MWLSELRSPKIAIWELGKQASLRAWMWLSLPEDQKQVGPENLCQGQGKMDNQTLEERKRKWENLPSSAFWCKQVLRLDCTCPHWQGGTYVRWLLVQMLSGLFQKSPHRHTQRAIPTTWASSSRELTITQTVLSSSLELSHTQTIAIG